MESQDNKLFSDVFEIVEKDKGGKKFDRVSRIQGRSENYEMDLTLDVNTEIYPIEIGDKFALMLASSLSLDGAEKTEIWREDLKDSLADDYEYVMYGKVFKYDDSNGSKVSIYISYGGLLMCLEGDYRHLQNIEVGKFIYLLMRKS
ncbi:RNA polymerase [Piromyces finnis]|uniref:DNA-directed RNA polymerases I, II, and III subunit RPABC3 n=1 Tax=Piromyces finnis TaxID=1754191 RepID=A0A1Y1VKI5_9FUNG|nr:RNA polymerase [Piromyces finnis]|eukprot:ORX58555.1 RNA polymerase [Piromyces finnis]